MRGKDWFEREINTYSPSPLDDALSLLFETFLEDMNQLTLNTWFIVFISQEGVTGLAMVIIPWNLFKVLIALGNLVKKSCKGLRVGKERVGVASSKSYNMMTSNVVVQSIEEGGIELNNNATLKGLPEEEEQEVGKEMKEFTKGV